MEGTEEILECLEGIINQKGDVADHLEGLKNMFPLGFLFLEEFYDYAIEIKVNSYPRLKEKHLWNKEIFEKSRKGLNAAKPKIIEKAKRILAKIDSGEISLTPQLGPEFLEYLKKKFSVETIEIEDSDFTKHYWKRENNSIEFWQIFGTLEVSERTGTLGHRPLVVKRKFEDLQARKDYINSKINKLLALGFKEVLKDEMVVLFVQIQYPKSKSQNENESHFWQMLDLRHEIEPFLNKRLWDKSIGSSFASDMGYGANILFEVYDEELGMNTIIEGLKEKDLDKRTLIAKRVNESESEGGYRVVFPEDFEGNFYSY